MIDTNVLVSGLITDQVDSPPYLIVDNMLQGRFSFLLSLDLLGEYRRVLLRPKIKKFHCLTEAEIDTILTQVTANGMLKEPSSVPAKGIDPGDQHIWNLVRNNPHTVLVTGDRILMRIMQKGANVLTPEEFIQQLKRQG